ncbi:MAG TPA: hypothetical protein V6C97_22090 [Oculatellaceae cyanobacterium]
MEIAIIILAAIAGLLRGGQFGYPRNLWYMKGAVIGAAICIISAIAFITIALAFNLPLLEVIVLFFYLFAIFEQIYTCSVLDR